MLTCPICKKRNAKRFCPAKGEKICAICCGTEREVTIDCPSDCPHLVAARRYEVEHRKPVSPDQVPYPDVKFSTQLVHERRPVVAGLGYTIMKLAHESTMLVDSDALQALEALAETYRTLRAGIHYEKPPDAPLPHTLYRQLAEFLQQYKVEDAGHAGFSSLKDTEIFYLLVFLLRVGRHETNGRPRSRAFLDFLRAQLPPVPELERSQPRIIIP